MSTDMGMMLLDLVCTVWEGLLLLVVFHTLTKQNRKRDLLFMVLFVASAELFTFVIPNMIGKLLVLFILFPVAAMLIYGIRLLDALLAYSLFMMGTVCGESAVTIFLVVFDIPTYYEGIDTIFFKWWWYILSHVVTTLFTLVVRRQMSRLVNSISKKEKLFLTFLSIGLIFTVAGVNSYGEVTDSLLKYLTFLGVILVFASMIQLILYFHRNAEARLEKERDEHQLKELQIQHRYYEELRKEEERVRAIYHDMKNHLLVLESQGKDSVENQEMIHSLQQQISDYENYVQTGNAFLDVVLRDKMKTAREQKTDFHAEIDFSEGDFMDGLDVSTIFGNALDNALEACAKLPEEERFLTIRTAPKHEMLVIQIENAARMEEQKNGTSKEDPFLHGFGLKNIRQAAEKYDGQCQWELKGGIFTLNILIPERGGVRDEQ